MTNTFIELMEIFIKIHNSYSIEIDEEWKPYVDLYMAIKNESIEDVRDLEEEIRLDLKNKNFFEYGNDFIIDEMKWKNYTVRTILFAPVYHMKEFKNKLTYAQYSCVIEFTGIEEETDAFLISSLFEKKIGKELLFIAKANGIHITEDALASFEDVLFKKIKTGERNIDVFDEDIDISDVIDEEKITAPIYTYRIYVRFPVGLKLNEALKRSQQTFNKWKKLREELAEALGLW